MKLRHITLAALAVVTGQAFATNNAPITVADLTATTTVDVFNLSGSSAAKSIIAGLVKQNCNTGSFTTFAGPSLTVKYPLTTSTTTISGSVGTIYACHAALGNDWGVAEDTVIVVNKRDFLGSGHGVFPVAGTGTAVEFTDPATCYDPTTADATHTAYNCYNTFNKVPDAGISDLEPTIFNGSFNRPFAFKTAAAVTNASFGQVTPVFSQVFGIAVTTALYSELQAAQGLTGSAVPSLSSAQVANLISQSIKSQGWAGVTTVANQNTGVNVCTRDIGSGTRAAANTYFLQNGANGLGPFLAKPSQSNTSAPTTTAGQFYINEAGSGGGVATCLANVQTAGAYGIGLLSLSQGTNANYKFVAIDGVAPSRDNAKVGKYGFWVESTIQSNIGAAGVNFAGGTLSSGALAFLKSFVAKASYADNLSQLGSPALAGVFALPSSTSTNVDADCSAYAGNFPAVGDDTTTWNTANTAGQQAADAFCSRYTRGGTNTKLPAFYK